MNRELQFRAWADDHFISLAGYPLSPDGGLKLPPDIVVEQYTGLHDKNGKEIYEGDIVHWWWPEGRFNSRARWGPPALVRFGTLNEGDDKERTGWIVEDCFLNEECEVIGNIHETPELLGVLS